MVIKEDNYVRHSRWEVNLDTVDGTIALGHNREDGYQTGQFHQTQYIGGLNLDTVDRTIALGHNREDGYQTRQLHQTQ